MVININGLLAGIPAILLNITLFLLFMFLLNNVVNRKIDANIKYSILFVFFSGFQVSFALFWIIFALTISYIITISSSKLCNYGVVGLQSCNERIIKITGEVIDLPQRQHIKNGKYGEFELLSKQMIDCPYTITVYGKLDMQNFVSFCISTEEEICVGIASSFCSRIAFFKASSLLMSFRASVSA